jgi:riboflavin kinase/FMN adenylyltransferase
LPSVVLTFFPHPSVVLRGREPSTALTLPEEKTALIHQLGVDHVVTQPFDREFSLISAEEILDWLHRAWRMRHIWAGEDFAFGYERKGTVGYLRQEGKARGLGVHIVPPLQMGGEVISSTRVREALRSGDVSRAATYLGRRFRLEGLVRRGAGRGRQLGIPTANIEIPEDRPVPGNGVYACWADVAGDPYRAVTNIGTRPTFESGLPQPVVEAHLLGFDSDLYGKRLGLAFVQRLRDEKKFAGPDALKVQIGRDILQAEDLFRAEEERDA